MSHIPFGLVAVLFIVYAMWGRANALIGAAFLAPYSQVIESGRVPLLNVQTLVVLLVAGSLLIPDPPSAAPRPRAKPPAALAIFAFMLVFSYLHSFVARIPQPYALYYVPWKNFLVFKDWATVLFLAYAAYVLAIDEKTIRRIFWGCILGWSGETAFCFLELVLRGGRVTGHLINANATGAFLATCAAASLGAYLALRGDFRRWLFFALGIAGAVATMGTRSRGAFLALGSTFLLVSFVKNRIVFLLLVVMAFSSPYWLPGPLMERLDQAVTVDDQGEVEPADTAASRIEIWEAGLRTIPDYPLGLGFGLYPYFVPKYGLEEHLTHVMRNAHNDVVLTTVEMGILGLLAFVALIIAFMRRAWVVAFGDDDAWCRAAGFAAFAGLFAMLAAGISGNNIFVLNRAGVLWVLLAAVARRADDLRTRAARGEEPAVAEARS